MPRNRTKWSFLALSALAFGIILVGLDIVTGGGVAGGIEARVSYLQRSGSAAPAMSAWLAFFAALFSLFQAVAAAKANAASQRTLEYHREESQEKERRHARRILAEITLKIGKRGGIRQVAKAIGEICGEWVDEIDLGKLSDKSRIKQSFRNKKPMQKCGIILEMVHKRRLYIEDISSYLLCENPASNQRLVEQEAAASFGEEYPDIRTFIKSNGGVCGKLYDNVTLVEDMVQKLVLNQDVVFAQSAISRGYIDPEDANLLLRQWLPVYQEWMQRFQAGGGNFAVREARFVLEHLAQLREGVTED